MAKYQVAFKATNSQGHTMTPSKVVEATNEQSAKSLALDKLKAGYPQWSNATWAVTSIRTV